MKLDELSDLQAEVNCVNRGEGIPSRVPYEFWAEVVYVEDKPVVTLRYPGLKYPFSIYLPNPASCDNGDSNPRRKEMPSIQGIGLNSCLMFLLHQTEIYSAGSMTTDEMVQDLVDQRDDVMLLTIPERWLSEWIPSKEFQKLGDRTVGDEGYYSEIGEYWNGWKVLVKK